MPSPFTWNEATATCSLLFANGHQKMSVKRTFVKNILIPSTNLIIDRQTDHWHNYLL